MAAVEEGLQALFGFLGPMGALVALFLLFMIDAAIFPALPELAIVVTYLYGAPEFEPLPRALLLLSMAMAGELAGNTLLYAWIRRLLVDRGHLPRWVERGMARWTQFLLVPDERIILLNRIAPVVPFVGAFMAVLRWSYPKSAAFILIGAAAKYSLLLLLVGSVGVAFRRDVATMITVAAVLILVSVSIAYAYIVRRRASPPPSGA